MEERRMNVRYDMFDCPVLISDNENDWEKASLVNISGTGAMVRTCSYFPSKSLYIELPRLFVKVLGSYFIKCEVMWRKHSEYIEDACEYGIKFEQVTAEEIEDLPQIIKKSV